MKKNNSLVLKVLLLICVFILNAHCVFPREFKGRFVNIGTLQSNPCDFTRLKDGRILLSRDGNAFQIYNPKTNKLEKIKQPKYKRLYVRPIVLNDGRVFIPGESFIYYKSVDYMKQQEGSEYAEIYDPVTDTYTQGAKMNITRYRFGASKLPDGRVLITNGYHPDRTKIRLDPRSETEVDHELGDSVHFDYQEDVLESEIYDPATDTYTIGPVSKLYRKPKPKEEPPKPKKVEKPDNNSDKPISLELNKSSTDKYIASDIRTKFPDLLPKKEPEPQPEERIHSSSVNYSLGCGLTITLKNGKVLVIADSNFSELYDPKTNSFELIKHGKNLRVPLNYELNLSNFMLPDGSVFIPNLSQSDKGRHFYIFNPETNEYSVTSDMDSETGWHHDGFVVLKDGRILMFGDYQPSEIGFCTYYRNLTIYDPKTDKFEYAGKVPRGMILVNGISLDNGNVLFITCSLSMFKPNVYAVLLKIKK